MDECWGEWRVDVPVVLLGWVVMLGKAPTVCMHLSGVPQGSHTLLFTLGRPFCLVPLSPPHPVHGGMR